MDDEAWLPIDGYEGYYEVSNLGNNTYGTAKIRAAVTSGKPVLQKSLEDGHIINAWATEGLAATFTCATQSGISMCCRGETKSSGGFAWEWAPWSGR